MLVHRDTPGTPRRRRLLVWLVAILATAATTGTIRALLRDESAGYLALAALASYLALYAVSKPGRWGPLARALGCVLSGPAVSAAAVLALRSWVPSRGPLLSIPGVLRELASSPVFYVPLAFTISWSLLGLRLRHPPRRRLRDRWSYAPLLVWSFFASWHLGFYFDSGMHYMPPAAQADVLWLGTWVLLISLLATLGAALPTLLQDRRRAEGLRLELLALLPVLLVLVDWGLFLSIFTTIWLKHGG